MRHFEYLPVNFFWAPFRIFTWLDGASDSKFNNVSRLRFEQKMTILGQKIYIYRVRHSEGSLGSRCDTLCRSVGVVREGKSIARECGNSLIRA